MLTLNVTNSLVFGHFLTLFSTGFFSTGSQSSTDNMLGRYNLFFYFLASQGMIGAVVALVNVSGGVIAKYFFDKNNHVSDYVVIGNILCFVELYVGI